ncbi:MAG: hypothetical protein M3Q27_05650 [Actinomycetota bacterium]|nr:hypothetical protein [Actinomycetota bacterium]
MTPSGRRLRCPHRCAGRPRPRGGGRLRARRALPGQRPRPRDPPRPRAVRRAPRRRGGRLARVVPRVGLGRGPGPLRPHTAGGAGPRRAGGRGRPRAARPAARLGGRGAGRRCPVDGPAGLAGRGRAPAPRAARGLRATLGARRGGGVPQRARPQGRPRWPA